MRTTAVLVCSALCAGARVLLSSISFPPAKEIVPNSYFVQLDTNHSHDTGPRSAHAQLYQELWESDVSYRVVREYTRGIFEGAVIEMKSDQDLPKLAAVSNVEFIAPTRLHSIPEPASSTKLHQKRDVTTRPTPWTHVLTGVDKLHKQGYRGQGIKIAIVDSGIDYMHPLLGGGFGPGHKVIGGYDFVGDAYNGSKGDVDPRPSDDPLDCYGHGTKVAGVIGANPGNPFGIVGVAPEAKINAYRVSGCAGETIDTILIDALLRAQRDGNHIINMSIGRSAGHAKTAVGRVANKIAKQGVVIVFSGGNRGDEGYWQGWHVSCALGVITAGTIDKPTRRVHSADVSNEGLSVTEWSSYGPTNDLYQAPSLVAPGTDIRTTVRVSQGSFQTVSGTSYAAPFVAGTVALWIQARRFLPKDTETICAALQNTAVPLRRNQTAGELFESTASQGAGLVHAYNAVHTMGRMQPAELLLKDTARFNRTWEIQIMNLRGYEVEYTLSHIPAGAMRTVEEAQTIVGRIPLIPHYAGVTFPVKRIIVPARSTKSFKVWFRQPSGLDPRTFPVYSGYVQATGSDGSKLHSLYVGLAASMRDMPVLDTSDGWYATKLIDRHNNSAGPDTVFTMLNDDVPTLRLRLVGPSPYIRVELINATAEASNNKHHAVGGSSKSGTPALPSPTARRHWYDRRPFRFFQKFKPAPAPASPLARAQSSFSGLIYSGRNVMRSGAGQGMSKKPYTERKIVYYSGGKSIPNGEYQVRVRALKMTSDRWKDPDWEEWMSPQFSVSRPEVAGG